jgi:ABC-type nitrate/sulfonate/bicarbonate transport system ATPase subunit
MIGLEALPVELRAHQPMEFIATSGMGMSTLIRVVVSWEDDAGEQEERFTVNTV